MRGLGVVAGCSTQPRQAKGSEREGKGKEEEEGKRTVGEEKGAVGGVGDDRYASGAGEAVGEGQKRREVRVRRRRLIREGRKRSAPRKPGSSLITVADIPARDEGGQKSRLRGKSATYSEP